MEFRAKQIAALLGGKLVGDGDHKVCDVAPIESAKSHQLAFITDEKYVSWLDKSEAGVILVTASLVKDRSLLSLEEGRKEYTGACVLVENARGAMAELLKIVAKMQNPPKRGVEQPSYVAEGVVVPEDAYIGAFAYIGKNVRLGKGVQIYPQCYVGDNSQIGDETVLYAGVRIYHDCVIGKDCILHSGAVIGADGFGFEPDANGVNQKIPQIGNVVIADDVEIGANTTIDRAMMGSTRVEKNVKLDNLVQVAHNVTVGESSFLCAQVGIAGSTTIGEHCILAGQVGVAGHLQIADRCVFGAQAGVAGHIRKAGMYQGSPAIDAMNWRRSSVGFKQLPELMHRINELEKE